MTAETVWTDRSDADDAEFAEVLAKWEATPVAEESLRERVAAAIAGTFREWMTRGYIGVERVEAAADAAIAVIRGEQ